MKGLPWALALALALGACKGKDRSGAEKDQGPDQTAWGDTVLARVGPGVITVERFTRRLDQRRRDAARRGIEAPEPAAILEQMIEEEALVQRAVAEGDLASDLDVRQRLIDRLIARHAADDVKRIPTTAELQAYHRKHPQQFSKAEHVRIAHILVAVKPGAAKREVAQARSKAEGLRRRAMNAPKLFATLAAKRSDDPSKKNGGLLGHQPVDSWKAVFGEGIAKALAGLEPGAIAPLVRSRRGFHIVKLVERVSGKNLFKVQRGQIMARYRRARGKAWRDKFVKSSLAGHSVTVNDTARHAAFARGSAAVAGRAQQPRSPK